MITEEDLDEAAILVFANKQDIAVMDANEVAERLDLQSVKDRIWFCQGTSAITGEGLAEGVKWLTNAINKQKRK